MTRPAETIADIDPEHPTEGPRPADEILLAAVAAGRPLAFEELVARWGGRVEAYLCHLLGDAAWAEDLTQEVFVKVYGGLHGREPGRSFRVWLFRIARNEGLDFLRRRSLQRRVIDALAAGLGPLSRVRRRRSTPSPLAMLETAEFLADLERSLGELPENQRSVFLLREREGFSYEEIGEIVGCPAKTVSTRLTRARAQLRSVLRGHLDVPPDRRADHD